MMSETALPVINIFYLQLQLLQKIHEGQKVVARAMEYAGSKTQLESLLTDINVCHVTITLSHVIYTHTLILHVCTYVMHIQYSLVCNITCM